jgi:prevent-host-death family protein
MSDEPTEMSAREVRAKLAGVVNAAIAGRTTYITQHGRRVAAIVPLALVKNLDKLGQHHEE